MSSSRRSKGRQKIEMKKMTNERNLHVTFSKRRSGLFKKASELCILSGAKVALIVFSPSNKVFSFGHPNVEALIHRYLTGALPHAPSTMHHSFLEANRKANECQLSEQLNVIRTEIEAEKKRVGELNKLQKASQTNWWWAGPIDEMNTQQLDQFKFALEDLKKVVTARQTASTPNPFFFPVGSSSSNLTLPSEMLQTSMFQNPLPMESNHDFDLNIMSRYGVNNMGVYGPDNGLY